MKLKRRASVLLVLLAAGFIFLLWPLKSKKFTIHWNERAWERKKDFLLSAEENKSGKSMPNVLLIIADDLGVHDISFYGNKMVSTPNIDNIANAGVAFSQAYCASPLCSPSRASILTGRYPQRFGFEYQMHDRYLKNRLEYLGFKYFISSDIWQPMFVDKVPRKADVEKQGLPPTETTIAELLKTRGYATAMIGKWHVGWQEVNKPLNLGFDEQYGFFDAHSLYAPIGTKGITDQRIEKDFTDQYNWKRGRNGHNGIFRNNFPIEEQEHLTDAITREAIDFIRKNENTPFFLMAAYNAPHTPLQAPDSYVEMFRHEPDPVKRVYYAMIKQLDDNIGRLIHELESSGLMANTLVIFLSDNGGAAYTFTTDNGPLRGGKISDFEGGLRIPFFMRWDSLIAPGIHYPHPVIAMDVFSTIAAAANLPLPRDREYDGTDLVHYLRYDSLVPHDRLFWQRGTSKAIRSGGWKAVWNEEFQDTLVFDLQHDPNETTDLYPGNKSLAADLTRAHRNWSSSLPSPLWPPVVYFREKLEDRWFYFED